MTVGYRTHIEVRNCHECPFLVTKVTSLGDFYSCDRCGDTLRRPNEPFPEKPPEWCPLRQGMVHVYVPSDDEVKAHR